MKEFLYTKIKKLRKIKKKWCSVHKPWGPKVFFVDLPEYDNLGDSAIALAQIKFLEKNSFSSDRIKIFTEREYKENVDYLKKHIGKKHLICTIGGGNFGNQWYSLELLRYEILKAFPKNPIVIFPQTVYFTEDEEGKKAIEVSKQHYENHPALTLVARETKSFEILNQLYKNPEKLLTPDIVLSTEMSDYGVKVKGRKGALLVFRSDVEKSMSDNDRESIKSQFERLNIECKETDMYGGCWVNNSNRSECVREKMQEFADSEIVVTDRLHGMVFAAITETPCIVFSNYNHKVKGTYEWIKHLDYIKYVESVEEALEHIPELLKMENCKFDNTPFIHEFDKLKEVIKQYAN